MTLTDDQTTDLLLAMEDRLNSHRSRILDADNEDGPDREHSIRRAQNDVAAAQALCDILEDAAEIVPRQVFGRVSLISKLGMVGLARPA